MQPSASFLPRRQEGAGSIASPFIHWAMQPLGYPSMTTLRPKKDISISISYAYPYLIGLHYKEVIWDIPILIFAYVLLGGPEDEKWLFGSTKLPEAAPFATCSNMSKGQY